MFGSQEVWKDKRNGSGEVMEGEKGTGRVGNERNKEKERSGKVPGMDETEKMRTDRQGRVGILVLTDKHISKLSWLPDQRLGLTMELTFLGIVCRVGPEGSSISDKG